MKYKDGLKTIKEMNVAGGPGGMFGYGGGGADIGSYGGSVGNADFYAPGDARIPKILGMGTTKSSSKKGKKKKRKGSIPIYRRAFTETIALESAESDFILNCLLYTERSDYQQIIKDTLDHFNIPYILDESNIILEGTDEYLQTVLEKIQGVITPEPFENEEVIALIGEMTLDPNDWKGIAAYKSILDYYHKFDPDKRQTIETFTDVFFERLNKGVKVEMEHTDDPKIAEQIARDHLWEDLDYYDKLAKIEKKK